MHPQKIVLILLSFLGMFATFLPWVVTPGVPVTDGTAGAGWITFGVYVVILVIIFTGNFRKRLSGFSLSCINILALLNTVYGFIIISDSKSVSLEAASGATSNAGIGLYILIITGFLILIFGFLLMGRKTPAIPPGQVELNITMKETKNQT